MVASEIWRIAVLVGVKLTGANALICALCGGMFVSSGQYVHPSVGIGRMALGSSMYMRH